MGGKTRTETLEIVSSEKESFLPYSFVQTWTCTFLIYLSSKRGRFLRMKTDFLYLFSLLVLFWGSGKSFTLFIRKKCTCTHLSKDWGTVSGVQRLSETCPSWQVEGWWSKGCCHPWNNRCLLEALSVMSAFLSVGEEAGERSGNKITECQVERVVWFEVKCANG